VLADLGGHAGDERASYPCRSFFQSYHRGQVQKQSQSHSVVML
jgi:hypothetical protein